MSEIEIPEDLFNKIMKITRDMDITLDELLVKVISNSYSSPNGTLLSNKDS